MRYVTSSHSLLLFILPYVWAGPYCALTPGNNAAIPRDIQGGGGGNANVSEDVVATTWYPGWHGSQFPPDNITWSAYNEIKYAFAITTGDASMVSLAPSDQQLLTQLAAAAHQNDVNMSLSIGGWTGSRYFSSSVASASNRTAFVSAVSALVTKYKLDGVDFDWEYPNGAGIGCNAVSPSDAANFLSFLQELRANSATKNIIVSAAVSVKPWAGPDGTPMTDVSEFAKVIDYIEIMNYDIWGSWSPSVGPNAPLDDSCAPAQDGSAKSAVKAWTDAGFPAGQIVLGVAAYGHSFHVQADAALTGGSKVAPYPPFDKAQQPHGDSWDADAGVDGCGNATPIGGIFNFWGLVDGGFLNSNGTAAAGVDFRYDNCSQTPYVYKPTTQTMVSYDDAESFAAKGQYINSAGLRGFAMWHAAGDYNNILLNSISNAMGIENQCQM